MFHKATPFFFFFLTEVPQGMDLISRRKGIAPILLGSRKKNIEKEGGPKGRLFYYCTLHFTIWWSYKPLLSLLQVFELICHIRETVFYTIRTTRISDKEIAFCVLVISFFQKNYNKDRIRPGCLIDIKALSFSYDTLHSTVPSPMNTMQELVRSSSEFSLRH